MPYFLAFVIGLFLLAALFRIDFFFYLLYLFFGIYILSRLWTQKAVQSISIERDYTERAFPDEQVRVQLTIRNGSVLPLPWLRVHESLPVQLKAPNFYRCVVSLMPYESKTLHYDLYCRRRGYYGLGPLLLSSGDLFGLRSLEQRMATSDAVTVYPRIVPLTSLGLPAQTPFGDVPSKQRIYEDPTRIMGVREYQSGDSLRHIHWKASAAVGTLQVKRFEPAISIEAQLFLNLNRDEYSITRAETASEMAIVTAASIANHLIEKRQAVGLSCNGTDPLLEDDQPVSLPPRKGNDQLMRILDILARAQLSRERPFVDVLRQASLRLTWGGTAIIVSSHADDPLFDHMVLMKRAGFHVILILVDPQTPFIRLQQRAMQVGVKSYQVWQERDLDVWR
jgi:uncharacterized protein (DUF58 family)